MDHLYFIGFGVVHSACNRIVISGVQLTLRKFYLSVESFGLLLPLGDCLAGENPSADPSPALRICISPMQLKGISIPGSVHSKGFYAKCHGALLQDWLSTLRGMNQNQSGDFL